MAFIAVSGEPGSRFLELAGMVSERLAGELITESDLERSIAGQFAGSKPFPHRAWAPAARLVLARAGLNHPHVVVACLGAEILCREMPGLFRVHVAAPESIRLSNLAVEWDCGRPGATARLRRLTVERAEIRKRRFGQKAGPPTAFDLTLNLQLLDTRALVEILMTALACLRLLDGTPLPAQVAADLQFQAGLQLARYGIVPSDRAQMEKKSFGHPSEEVFANLLDLYRIPWDYEPRSFPLQWDKDGKVSEAFTPDFYLPELDLYVELTTMKQANVTRKNRKIRRLKTIYPHVNIEIFYQKDVQELVTKCRLPERLTR